MTKNIQQRIVNPAVLVIDVQNDFCSEHGMLNKLGRNVSHIQQMADNLIHFLSGIQKLGMPTAYIKSNYDKKYLSKNIYESYGENGLADLCKSDSWGEGFYKIMPDKDVFVKHRYDAFTNKAFVRWLKKNIIKTLILTGCQTDVCVDSTARSGFIRGYNIVAMKDCLASTDINSHKRVLKFMSKYYNARIRDSKVPLRKIRGCNSCHAV